MNKEVEIKLNYERRDYESLIINLGQYEAEKIVELVSLVKQEKSLRIESDLSNFIRNLWNNNELVSNMEKANNYYLMKVRVLKKIKELIIGFAPKKNASECCVQMRDTHYMNMFKPEELDDLLTIELFYAIVWHHLYMIRQNLMNPGRIGSAYAESRIRKELQVEFMAIQDFLNRVGAQQAISTSLKTLSIKEDISILIGSIKGLL